MRINLMLTTIYIMTSLTSCGQNRKHSTENDEKQFLIQDKIASNINILNDAWHNNENDDWEAPVDTVQWLSQMHNGTDCYFYKDSTFEICIWSYSVSIGLRASSITGRYQYDHETKEIALDFDEESKQRTTSNSKGKPYPVAYFTMEGLKIKDRLHTRHDIKNEFLILSKSCLKIIEETGNNIRVELYAFKENGERISFGQQTYIREDLEEGNAGRRPLGVSADSAK